MTSWQLWTVLCVTCNTHCSKFQTNTYCTVGQTGHMHYTFTPNLSWASVGWAWKDGKHVGMLACMCVCVTAQQWGQAADESLSQNLCLEYKHVRMCEKACVCTTATGSFVLVLRVIMVDDEPGYSEPVCGRAGGYRQGVTAGKLWNFSNLC